jgi:predicted 3-demethylubiquinone-9 3-methyltransferase (glyoxalase superfamily)
MARFALRSPHHRTRRPLVDALATSRRLAGALVAAALLVGCKVTADAPTDDTARATPFLMFQNGRAHEALDFYVATLPDTRVVALEEFGAGDVGPAGSVKFATLDVAGQRVHCTDSPAPHAFDFTPSFSFWFECASADEVDRLAAALSDGGLFLMPPADYGFAPRFAWVQDRFGVSWQLVFGHAGALPSRDAAADSDR